MEGERRKLVIIGLALLVVAAGAFVISNRPREAPVIVRISYLNITASLPLFIAEEKGFLAEEGVRHESTPIATSNQLPLCSS